MAARSGRLRPSASSRTRPGDRGRRRPCARSPARRPRCAARHPQRRARRRPHGWPAGAGAPPPTRRRAGVRPQGGQARLDHRVGVGPGGGGHAGGQRRGRQLVVGQQHQRGVEQRAPGRACRAARRGGATGDAAIEAAPARPGAGGAARRPWAGTPRRRPPGPGWWPPPPSGAGRSAAGPAPGERRGQHAVAVHRRGAGREHPAELGGEGEGLGRRRRRACAGARRSRARRPPPRSRRSAAASVTSHPR